MIQETGKHNEWMNARPEGLSWSLYCITWGFVWKLCRKLCTVCVFLFFLSFDDESYHCGVDYISDSPSWVCSAKARSYSPLGPTPAEKQAVFQRSVSRKSVEFGCFVVSCFIKQTWTNNIWKIEKGIKVKTIAEDSPSFQRFLCSVLANM